MKRILIVLAVLLLLCASLIGIFISAPRTVTNTPLSLELPKINFPYNQAEKFTYEATFNGLKVGTFNFEYKGRKDNLDLVIVTNKINVLNIFQIDSTESVYIDAYTCLPKRVERQVVFFGKPEYIVEEYNQNDGWVNIVQEKGVKTKNTLIPQKPPIHNAHSLFFVYPLKLEDKIGSSIDYYLPLEKVNIRVKEIRSVATPDGIKQFYVLEVNPKKIIIELERDKRMPLRLEMPVLWGKLVITKK